MKDFNEATEEKRKDILLKFHSAFAVNSSDNTYQEFLKLLNGDSSDCKRLIMSIRNELKVSTKKNDDAKTKPMNRGGSNAEY